MMNDKGWNDLDRQAEKEGAAVSKQNGVRSDLCRKSHRSGGAKSADGWPPVVRRVMRRLAA